MTRKNIRELLPDMILNGRTVMDPETGVLYCDWSCSGFTVGVEGSSLRIRVNPEADAIQQSAGEPPLPLLWPEIGVAAREGLLFREECRESRWITVYEGKEYASREITVTKLNENARGKLGVMELETDGGFFRPQQPIKKRIEVVGDSITCGFGNEPPAMSGLIRENGRNTYGFIAASLLDADVSLVGVSGICGVRQQGKGEPAMEDLYPYADALLAVKHGSAPEEWDFGKRRNDAVVINLGTNDAVRIRSAFDEEEKEELRSTFFRRYTEFVRTVRRLNGPQCLILCCAGPMDYSLAPEIRRAAEAVDPEMRSGRVLYFEFAPIDPVAEGYGSEFHPSGVTHRRMGIELAGQLRKNLQ